MFQADTITSDGWLQIDLGQMYAIESINVKGVAGSPYHPPAYTNNLAIFTSSTKIMFSNTDRKTIAELEADITVNKIGVTSGLSATNYQNSFATEKTVQVANTITGTNNAETLTGSTGDDVINAQGGADTLTGNGGSDYFVYNAVADSAKATADTVTDFAKGNDKLVLIDLLASVTTGLSIANFNKVAFWDNANKTLFIKTDVADVADVGSTAALSDGTNADVAIALNSASDITTLSDFTASNLILS